MNPKILKFKKNDLEINVYFYSDENDYYISLSDTAKLFNTSKSNIVYHYKKLVEKDSEKNRTVQKNGVKRSNFEWFKNDNQNGSRVQKNGLTRSKFERVKIDGKFNEIRLISLDSILELQTLYESNAGDEIKQFIDEHNNTKIIIYNNGKMDLPINVDYEHETIWSTIKQMADLFETVTDNIYKHIKRIYEDKEIERSVVDKKSVTETTWIKQQETLPVFNQKLTTESTFKNYLNVEPVSKKGSKIQSVYEKPFASDSLSKENLATQKTMMIKADDGKLYPTTVYNLDMVLAVGYRVKSTAAMRFRNWASSVLKEVMTKGVSYDFDRLLKTKYSTEELLLIIIKLMQRQNNEIVYYDGAELRGFIEIKRFLETAKHEIIIIDNYLGHSFDEVLSRINVEKTIITNGKNTKIESNDSYKVIKSSIFHDRFIIVDDSCYNFGKSIDDLGGNFSLGKRVNDEVIIQALKNKKNELMKKEELDIHN